MKANTVCFSSSSATKEPRLSSFWPTMRNQIAIWFSHDVCYLWRALDQHGHVLNIPVQRRRDKKTAKKFFRKLPKGLTYVARKIILDKLKSHGAAEVSAPNHEGVLRVRADTARSAGSWSPMG